MISPLERPDPVSGFGDTSPGISTLGGDALGSRWESQYSIMFVNDASLDSSRESGFPDDYDEDNRPVAQFSLLKTRGEEGEVANNVCGLCSTLTDHPGLIYFQTFINRTPR